MDIFNSIRARFSKPSLQNIPVQIMPYNLRQTLSHFKNQSYDNTYPSVARIADQFMTVLPYAVDDNGEKTKTVPNVIEVLGNPNTEMSATDFKLALAVMTLVHRKVYLLAWHREGNKAVPGGPITESNLIGLTFLEDVQETIINGKKTYWSGNTSYTTNDVIEVYNGLDPYNLSKGYSPSVAACKWATVDDYIVEYQRGFFANGAVPAGEFIITAATVEEYNKIVDELQKHHRGAGKNNNVVYTHNPISPITGQAVGAQIQWVPFNVNNSDMSLDELFEQANKKLDSAFGVPASVRGVNDNNTYASVRIDEQTFIKFAVYPFCLKIWTRLTHELNRLTGGLGYAISFSLDVPNVADEDKAASERKKIDLETLTAAIDAGFSLESTVEAFDMPGSYLKLAEGYVKPEAKGNHLVISAKDSLNHDCHTGCCDKFHNAIDEDGNYTPDTQEQAIVAAANAFMSGQIEDAVEALSNDLDVPNEPSEALVESFVATAILAAIVVLLSRGQEQYVSGIALLADAGISTSSTSSFILNQTSIDGYKDYLKKLGLSYGADTTKSIKSILETAATQSWDKETTAAQLRNIVNTDEWRVQRLARTESTRQQSFASLEAMMQLENETGSKLYKMWNAHSGACEYCRSFDGKKERLNSPFLGLDDTISGKDGSKFTNTFMDIDDANLHPNCGCWLSYTVES